MKIFRFNPETGAYLGEDFADEASMERDNYVVPDDATTIAPPEIEQGHVPFFNSRDQCWEMRPRRWNACETA